jgi:hypothetical protein
VGSLYVRNDGAGAGTSFYVCANTGVGTYAWEGPFNPVGGGGGGGATQFSELNDFKATATSSTVLTITQGNYAVGNYAFPTPIGGTVTFSGGGGVALVYLDENGQLVTNATTGVTSSAVTGQMTFTNSAAPVVPDTAVPICSLSIAAGTYSIVQCGQATRLRNSVTVAGTGLTKTVSNGRSTFAVDPAAVCLTTGNCGGGTTTGAGAPASTGCDSSGEVGQSYTDTNVGGDDWKCRAVAAGTYLWLPLSSPGSSNTHSVADDFYNGLTQTGILGETNITRNEVGTGALAYVAGEANHLGIRRYTTATADNDNGAFVWQGGSNLIPNVSTTTSWFFRAVFRTDPTAVTNALFCAGLCGSTGTPSTSHAAIIYDTDASHTTWHLKNSNGGVATGTDIDTTVTVTAGQWVTYTAWSVTAGTICHSINGTAPSCLTGNLQTSANSPSVAVQTRVAATAKAIDVDYMEFASWNFTR